MNCPNDEKLVALAVGDLPEKEQRELREHVENCSSCRTEHTRCETLLNTLNDRERPDVDSAFVQRVMNEAEHQLYNDQPNRSTRSGWSLPVFSRFTRRNAPWIASLSLHCCLIFLVLLLAISQFAGTTRHSTKGEVMTGVPVMSAEDEPEADAYRERLLWRKRLRTLRTGTSTADAPCPDDAAHSERIERISKKLIASRTENGFWADSNGEDRIHTTALVLLALLRDGHAPDKTGNAPAAAAHEGVTYITEQQQENGRIGSEEAPFTVHSIATAALMEASLFSDSTDVQNHALNALEYLARTLSSDIERVNTDYWTFVSLKLGENIGHPRAGQLMRDPVLTMQKKSDRMSSDLVVLPFRRSSASARQKKRVNALLNRWETSIDEDEENPFTSNDPVVVAHLAYVVDGFNQRLTEVMNNLKDVNTEQLSAPAQLARYALVLQTCRSYPR